MVYLITALLYVVIPNTYAFIGNHLDFTYPKLAIIYFVALLILSLFAINLFRIKQVVFNLSKIDVFVLLFLLSFLLSTIFSINPSVSIFSEFFGSVKNGLLITLSLVIIYFYFKSYFKKENLRIISWVAIAGLIPDILWGYLTHSVETYYSGISLRMASVEFNTIFFANYALILLPISLGLAFSEKRILPKVLASLIFFAGIFEIVTSLTRSVWIVSILILILFAFRTRKSFSKPLIPVVLAILFILFPLIYFLYPTLSPRITAIWHDPAQSNSVLIRLDEQKAALNIFKDHILLGSGPNTIRYVYQQYRNPILNLNSAEWNNFTSYIRNYYLEVAATTGLLGIILFLEIIINFLRNLKDIFKSQDFLFLGVFFSWVAIVTHFLFYGAIPISLVFFWSLTGILLSLSSPKIIYSKTLQLSESFLFRVTCYLLLPTFILCSLFLTFQDVRSKLIFKSVPQNSATTDTLNKISEAEKLNPFDSSYKLEYAFRQIHTVSFELKSKDPNVERIKDRLQKAQERLELAEKIDPGNPFTAYRESERAYFLFRVAKYEKQDRSEEFKEALTAAINAEKLAPTLPDYVDQVTQVYLENDARSLNEAEAQARKTIIIAPTYSQAWHHLAEALKQQGKFDEAIKTYEETLKYDPNNPVSKSEIEIIKKLQEAH